METTIDKTSIRRWKKYDEYMASSLPSRITIPKGWKSIPLKYAVEDERRITYGIVQCGPNIPNGIPYIRPVDMTDEGGAQIHELQRTSQAIASSYKRSTVKEGDLVVSIGPSFGKVMIVTKELTGANLTQGTARVAPKSNIYSRFLFWALRAKYTHETWDAECSGATFRALTLETLSNNRVVIPSEFVEQQAIAAFLDRETARIDTLIERKERLITLLEEKRQAVISHAVTKGLNPNAKMKDSGIEWFGDVPEHWKVTRLGWVSETINDINHEMPQSVEHGVPFLSAKDLLDDGSLNFTQNIKFISEEDFERLSRKILPKRSDIIYSRIGACLGKARLVESDERFLVSYSCCVVRLDKDQAFPYFFRYLLDADLVLTEAKMRTQGIGVPDLGLGEISRFPVPLPPLKEQQQIASYLDASIAKIRELSRRVKDGVERLREYRTALISAAVTGQIDVREEVEIDG